ncbi:MAG: tetratricopeptide repeat protein [Myxococcaceae bacterium]|nr:tetratricopeptide repeat protein [Myxococcaceae bacterium]
MAVAETPNNNSDWKKRESLGSALLQIVVVGVVLAVAVYFFYARTTRRKEIADKLKEARTVALRGNPGDLAKATKQLEEIFALDSSAKDALAFAASIETDRWLVHGVSGAEQKAKDYLARAESEDSRTEDRFGTKVLHMIAAGKAKEAAEYAEDLRKKGASSAKLWYGIAMAYERQGNVALARPAFQQAIEKAWKNPAYYAGYGEALLDQAEYRMAVDILSKGLNNNPDHLLSRIDLALARIYREDRVKDAADSLKEILAATDELTPGLKARALAANAELANFEHRFDDALKAADEALAVNPNERYALFARARALAMKKDPGALDAFKKAIAQDPMAPGPYITGAKLLADAGNFDGAIALLDDYEKAYANVTVTQADGSEKKALDRDDRYWVARGDTLRAAGKLDDAMAAYDKAIAVDSVNRTRAHYAKGALLLEKKDYDKALEELDLVTPDDGTGQIAEAYAAKGQVLFAKKDFVNGCQNFAFALTRMKAQQVAREKMNALLESVSKDLVANGQRAMAKAWETEAKPLIQ